MNIFLVTVKLPKNPNHDPRNKMAGPCPVTGNLCTDITGEHHTVLITTDAPYKQVEADFTAGFGHVTRIEQLNS